MRHEQTMYVALTRPTDRLYVLWSHDTPSLKELVRNLETAGAVTPPS